MRKIFIKSSIIIIWQGPVYVSATFNLQQVTYICADIQYYKGGPYHSWLEKLAWDSYFHLHNRFHLI